MSLRIEALVRGVIPLELLVLESLSREVLAVHRPSRLLRVGR